LYKEKIPRRMDGAPVKSFFFARLIVSDVLYKTTFRGGKKMKK